MKYFYVIKEYLQVAWQCLAYIYKFDKIGTIRRIAILLVFPIIANILNIANAHLADTLQKNFGTGLMSYVLPIFIVVMVIEVTDMVFRYLNQSINYQWRTQLGLIMAIERQNKKSQFTLPFIDSKDYEEMNQRIQYSGSGFDSQLALLNSIPNFLQMCINIVFSIYIIASFSYVYTLIILITTLPKFFISFSDSFARRKTFEKYLTYQRMTGQYGNQFANYTSLKDSKASGSTSAILDIFSTRRKFYLDIQYKVFKRYLNLAFITNFIALFVGFVVQYAVIQDVVFGMLLIGQATLIVAQSFRFQDTIISFSNFLPEQYENIVSAKYLFLYLSTKENVEKHNATTHTTDENTVSDSIELKNVLFTYPDVHFEEMRGLMKEIDTVSEKFFGLTKETDDVVDKKSNNFTLTIPSLTIKKGERVAIVGKNGNGKTTFLQLVLNLYQPEQGEVRVFGNTLRDMNQTDVQKYFSTLFQDYGQTNFQVHEYIGLSEINNPDIERVKSAAKTATASDFIEKWKDTYTQQLGISFKGVKPSKGQWQKLALARALYKDAPVLVLDEPTAAIDAVSAKRIFENLAQLDPEKILLFVCHNMVDVPLVATRVLVFDDGKIVGDGTHAELLKTCAVYKELYESEVRG
jgi:ABC-type multidrug transport system fused ATPase/permease subunit